MIINKISVLADGFVNCNSAFYSTCDILTSDLELVLYKGINEVRTEIDSGAWAHSYLISMYKYKKKDFTLFDEPQILINDTLEVFLTELSEYACYLDLSYPLFSSRKSAKELIQRGIKKYKLPYTFEDVSSIFSLSKERVNMPLRIQGNEKFRAMAAVAFCQNKQVFCYPWMSKSRFDGFHSHITDSIRVLEELGKIVFLPVGK